MDELLKDIWPILLTALVTAAAGYVGYIHNLKVRVAVLEKTIEDLLRTIDSMQKRMDSHSKKQDDILEKIGSMEKEVLKQMGVMGASIGSLASDVKNLNNLLSITDTGIVLKRQK